MKNDSFSIDDLHHISAFAHKLKESTDGLIRRNFVAKLKKDMDDKMVVGVDMAKGKPMSSVQVGSNLTVKDVIYTLGSDFNKNVNLRVKPIIAGREPTGDHAILIEWPEDA